MIIGTKLFSEIEINEKMIISFNDGIPGLENYKKFVLLDIEGSSMKALQSVEEKELCLIVITPWDYFKEYEIQLSKEEIGKLKLNSSSDAIVLNVANIREDKVTVNLAAPIIINVLNNIGKQIILTNSNYSIRQEIKC